DGRPEAGPEGLLCLHAGGGHAGTEGTLSAAKTPCGARLGRAEPAYRGRRDQPGELSLAGPPQGRRGAGLQKPSNLAVELHCPIGGQVRRVSSTVLDRTNEAR